MEQTLTPGLGRGTMALEKGGSQALVDAPLQSRTRQRQGCTPSELLLSHSVPLAALALMISLALNHNFSPSLKASVLLRAGTVMLSTSLGEASVA